jgi:predicted enzyme related to lactoylglutathione lyase
MLRLDHITFSCDDPARLAEFWGRLLDYETAAAGDSWLATDPRGEGGRLLFNRMAKSPTIELPIHVDVNVPDREAELTRILELGGHLVTTKTHRMGDFETTWTVMRDPEKNGFCIETLENAPPQRHLSNVTFACAEPRELGRFWANALGWPDEDMDEGFLQRFRDAGVDERQITSFHLLRQPEGRRPRFLFQRREKSRPESHPIHLDFGTDDREAEIERLTSAGASVVETKVGTNITFTVMRDPEGNPFCVG